MKNLINGHKKVFFGISIIAVILVVFIIFKVNTNNTNSKHGNNNSYTNNKTITFNQLANDNKERLWFDVHGFSNSPDTLNVSTDLKRDNGINALYVTKNGYITKYDSSNVTNSTDPKYKNNKLTIADISKYSDKEIIEKFKELDKLNFEAYINGWVTNSNALNKPDDANTYKALKYNVPKKSKIEIEASDDGTDNKITNEVITNVYEWKADEIANSDPNSDGGIIGGKIEFKPGYYKKESLMLGARKINNSLPKTNIVDGINYGGLGGNILTKIGKDQTLTFDSYDDKNVKRGNN